MKDYEFEEMLEKILDSFRRFSINNYVSSKDMPIEILRELYNRGKKDKEQEIEEKQDV